jgi:hypothetical protein
MGDEIEIMQCFAYEHLPAELAEISRPFCVVAREMAALLPANTQRDAALQRLLEAKDAAVRARIIARQGAA